MHVVVTVCYVLSWHERAKGCLYSLSDGCGKGMTRLTDTRIIYSQTAGSVALNPSHRSLSQRLKLIQLNVSNVRDVCGTNVREAC